MSVDEKEDAARKALRYVKPGMTIGLGTGSTSACFIKLLGEKEQKKKLGLRCIATSVKSEGLARECGLNLVGFGEAGCIDLAVDGADVIVGRNLLKGLGGGAITREKAVDYRAAKFIVIADKSKVKEVFGGIVAVEVLQFAADAVKRELEGMGAKSAEFRMSEGKKFISDNGNFMLDAVFDGIPAPAKMERDLKLIPGVVENGIFTRKCKVIVGGI
jgi:ribose 5-phosphate isomerase A